MSELNINTTEYALLAATTVFFSGINHLAVQIWIKFGIEIMNFVVIRLFTDAKCTNFVLILFHQNCLLYKSIPFSLHTCCNFLPSQLHIPFSAILSFLCSTLQKK